LRARWLAFERSGQEKIKARMAILEVVAWACFERER
jgi:hypothetical protein